MRARRLRRFVSESVEPTSIANSIGRCAEIETPTPTSLTQSININNTSVAVPPTIVTTTTTMVISPSSTSISMSDSNISNSENITLRTVNKMSISTEEDEDVHKQKLQKFNDEIHNDVESNNIFSATGKFSSFDTYIYIYLLLNI